MNVKCVVVGYLETNCYIIENKTECLIIDPGDEAEKIISNIDKRVVGIIITHHHFDHIGALNDLINHYKVKEYNMSNLSEGINKIGSFEFSTIYTKGHLDDSITLYFKDINSMFVGDFIFAGSIGRVDLEGANISDMKESIKKILTYSPSIKIFPGHGCSTTLMDEIDNLNYFYDNLK